MSKKTPKPLIVPVAVSWLFWCHSAWAGEPVTSPPGPDVQKLIDQIKDSASVDQRGEFSFRLWREVKLGFFVRYPDTEIDQISDFLKSEDRPVVYWSAWTLAAIGPDARRAAPILQTTELKWECKFRAHQDSRTGQTVRHLMSAMRDLKVAPLPAGCPWGSGPSDIPTQAH